MAYSIALNGDYSKVFVSGSTDSPVFRPLSNPYTPHKIGPGGRKDVMVAKFTSTGELDYLVAMGGASSMGVGGDDRGLGIVADNDSNAIVTGWTESNNFPTTNGAYDRTKGGTRDAFAAKITHQVGQNPSLAYSTFLGGGSDDTGTDIAYDPSKDNAWIVGYTNSPANQGFGQNPTRIIPIELGSLGDEDGFVLRLTGAGSPLSATDNPPYFAFLGGTKNDRGLGIAVTVSTSTLVYLAGWTESSPADGALTVNGVFKTYRGNREGFVVLIDPLVAGVGSVQYATYLGGKDADQGNAIAVDTVGDAYVAGATASNNLRPAREPPVPGFQPRYGGGTADGFAVKIRRAPPANRPPGMGAVGNWEVLVGTPLTFSVTATDDDGDPIQYHLDENAPAGATIDPNTGQFFWIPTEVGVYAFGIQASDPYYTFDEQLATIVVTDQGQWASFVYDFSSEWSPTEWSAAQALHPPDTFGYGGSATAWSASLADNGMVEFITLGFTTPVYATGVTIRETNGNGFVYAIDLLDENYEVLESFDVVDDSPPDIPVDLVISFGPTWYLVKAVTIHTDTNHAPDIWEEIDAVMLHGSGSGGEGLGSGSAPLSASRGARAVSIRRPSPGPSATFSASSPARVGVPVTFRFTNPSYRGTSTSAFRYSFDFNNDRDFTDPGELSAVASSMASFTFTKRGWQVVHGRIIAPDGRFTDFWTRVFVQ